MTQDSFNRDDLGREIRDVLNANFGEVEIISVEIENDVSSMDDADDGIEMTVVFRGTTDQLVRNRPAALFQMVEEKLSSLSRDAFPVFNFVWSDQRR